MRLVKQGGEVGGLGDRVWDAGGRSRPLYWQEDWQQQRQDRQWKTASVRFSLVGVHLAVILQPPLDKGSEAQGTNS